MDNIQDLAGEISLEFPARTQDEERFLVIRKIEEKHWSGVITYESI